MQDTAPESTPPRVRLAPPATAAERRAALLAALPQPGKVTVDDATLGRFVSHSRLSDSLRSFAYEVVRLDLLVQSGQQQVALLGQALQEAHDALRAEAADPPAS